MIRKQRKTSPWVEKTRRVLAIICYAIVLTFLAVWVWKTYVA